MQKALSEIIAIIPARGGSKGIPGKNIRLLAGKPLLAYSIEHARSTPAVSRTVVSTDDLKIGEVAQQYGAEVIWRPAEFSGDTASSESALLYTLDHLRDTEGYEPELVLFLQCTSPIRVADDLTHAIGQFYEQGADSLLSVVPFHTFIWQRINGQSQALDYDYHHRPRRQERNPEYIENGSFYIFKPWVLREYNNRLGGKIAMYEMSRPSSFDIDTAEDLELCEIVMNWFKHATSEKTE